MTLVFPHGVGKSVKAKGQDRKSETAGDMLLNPLQQVSGGAPAIPDTRESRSKGSMIWYGALSISQ